MNTSIEMALRIEENAAAVRDLIAKRDYLMACPLTPNVYAGRKTGNVYPAIAEINQSIAEIVRIDLLEGRVAY